MNYLELGRASRWLFLAAAAIAVVFGVVWNAMPYYYNDRENALDALRIAGWEYVKLGDLDIHACRKFEGWPPLNYNAVGAEQHFGPRENKPGKICWKKNGQPKIIWDKD